MLIFDRSIGRGVKIHNKRITNHFFVETLASTIRWLCKDFTGVKWQSYPFNAAFGRIMYNLNIIIKLIWRCFQHEQLKMNFRWDVEVTLSSSSSLSGCTSLMVQLCIKPNCLFSSLPIHGWDAYLNWKVLKRR